MANKDFKTDAADIFVQRLTETQQPEQRRRPQARKRTGATEKKQERICVMMDSELMESVRAIAYHERMRIVDIFRKSVEGYVEKYERKNGEIQKR